MRHRLSILYALLLFPFAQIFAQMHERRIYLWDVSESLHMKYGNKMWEPLKNALKESINNIAENAQDEIVLIPFYDNTPLVRHTVPATAEGKEELKKAIAARGGNPVAIGKRMTYITWAIQQTYSYLHPDFTTYVFVYTDGQDESGAGKLREELAKLGAKTQNKECYAFYVLVYPDAMNDDVKNAANKYDNFWIVKDANVKISNITLQQPIIYNVRDDKSARIKITGNTNTFAGTIQLKSDDPYYDLNVSNVDIKNGYVDFVLNKKNGTNPPVEHKLKTKVVATGTGDYSFAAPKELNIDCINKPERTLKIRFK